MVRSRTTVCPGIEGRALQLMGPALSWSSRWKSIHRKLQNDKRQQQKESGLEESSRQNKRPVHRLSECDNSPEKPNPTLTRTEV